MTIIKNVLAISAEALYLVLTMDFNATPEIVSE